MVVKCHEKRARRIWQAHVPTKFTAFLWPAPTITHMVTDPVIITTQFENGWEFSPIYEPSLHVSLFLMFTAFWTRIPPTTPPPPFFFFFFDRLFAAGFPRAVFFFAMAEAWGPGPFLTLKKDTRVFLKPTGHPRWPRVTEGNSRLFNLFLHFNTRKNYTSC